MNKPKFWRGLEELEQSPEFVAAAGKEFPSDVPMEDTLANASDDSLLGNTDRRNFLKVLGFGVTAATLAACTETPVKYAIPFAEKPDDMQPGVPNYYASTTPEGVPVTVKTRAGRPIKLEGNPDSSLTQGGTDALTQAAVLNLYDIDRLRQPKKGQSDSSWDILDQEIGAKLAQIKASSGKIALVSNSILSPSAKAIVDAFAAAYNGTHYVYDAVSYSAIAEANSVNFGKKAIPAYKFEKADVIAAFNADFLGTWLSPTQFSRSYMVNRDPKKKKMSRHFQLEGVMTISGANADLRYPIKPSEEGLLLANLYNKIAAKLGKPSLSGVADRNVAANGLDKVANELVAASGKSMVISGTNDVNIQTIVNGINSMLGNIGTTIDLDNAVNYKQGDDKSFGEFASQLSNGAFAGVFFIDANPVYNTTAGAQVAAVLKSGVLSVAFTTKADETSELCQYTAALSHFLESWGDSKQVAGVYSLVQPAINPIFETRQYEECLLKWAGNTTSVFDYVKNYWTANILSGASWEDTLRKGVFEATPSVATAKSFAGDVQSAANAAGGKAVAGAEVTFYEKVGIRDGKYANNPWLQELPDPITRVTWDDYITVPFEYAKKNGIKMGNVMDVKIGGKSYKLPALVQVGQANEVFGIAFGYGRTNAGRVAKLVGGINVFAIAAGSVTVTKTSEQFDLACVQTHDTMRDPEKLDSLLATDFDRSDEILRTTILEKYNKDPFAGNERRKEVKEHLYTLWESHYKDLDSNKYIRWVMAIDMNKCTGCGTCVVACNAENNVSVVGKKEVLTRREMHWIRIDRYYEGDEADPHKISVAFQPMMCQHCAHASCETVCPVLATIHSTEGLNQMAYNRCVGTRYCANNCPYKVRRFNWFNYVNGRQFPDINPAHETNPLGQLVLNPDVTVRFRGVMEKCSFCVQRLQDAKLKAKVHAQSTFAKPTDGDVKTACQQACPTGAIVFGDLNDPNSVVSQYFRDERSYAVIEEVKTQPSVAYMTLVRNRTAEEDALYVPSYEKPAAHKEGAHA